MMMMKGQGSHLGNSHNETNNFQSRFQSQTAGVNFMLNTNKDVGASLLPLNTSQSTSDGSAGSDSRGKVS